MHVYWVYITFADSTVYLRNTKRCWSHLIILSDSNAINRICSVHINISSGASKSWLECPRAESTRQHKSNECFANDCSIMRPRCFREEIWKWEEHQQFSITFVWQSGAIMAMEAELLECVLSLSFCCLWALSIFPLKMVTIKRPGSRTGPGSRTCLWICEVYSSTMKAFCKLVQFGEPFGYKGEEQWRTARRCVPSSFLCLALVCAGLPIAR